MGPSTLDVWTALHATPGLGAKGLARLALTLSDRNIVAVELLGSTTAQLVELGLSPKVAEAAASSLADVQGAPVEKGFTLAPGIAGYPEQRLGDNPPLPVLLRYNSESDLLSQPTIGISGSRNADHRSLQLVDDLIAALAGTGTVVVSGNAKGVDARAHQAAIDHDLATIAVLAEGLGSFRRSWSGGKPGRTLAVSEFPHQTSWKPRQAMQRNATIAALSDVVIVIEAGESGGSLAMGRLCLKAGVPLAVPERHELGAEGNAILIAEGATPLPTDDIVASRDLVLGLADRSEVPPETSTQTSLFEGMT